MKTIKNTTIYKCEYCGKNYQMRKWCELHEKNCNRNPDNQMICPWCDHCEMKTMYHIKWVPCQIHGEREEDSETEAYFCNKKGVWIYPHSVCKNPILQEDIEDEINNIPMPKNCEHFENKY